MIKTNDDNLDSFADIAAPPTGYQIDISHRLPKKENFAAGRILKG